MAATYKFFFVSKEDAKEGTKSGYRYADANRDKWVDAGNEYDGIITVGTAKGKDYVVHDGIVYDLAKVYYLPDETAVLSVCIENVTGPEIREFN